MAILKMKRQLNLTEFLLYFSVWQVAGLIIYIFSDLGFGLGLIVCVFQLIGIWLYDFLKLYLFKQEVEETSPEESLIDVATIAGKDYTGISTTQCEYFPVLWDEDNLPMNLILPSEVVSAIKNSFKLENYYVPLKNSTVSEFLQNNNIKINGVKFELDEEYVKKLEDEKAKTDKYWGIKALPTPEQESEKQIENKNKFPTSREYLGFIPSTLTTGASKGGKNKYIFKVDTIGMDPDAALKYAKEVKKNIKKKPKVNPKTGEINFNIKKAKAKTQAPPPSKPPKRAKKTTKNSSKS